VSRRRLAGRLASALVAAGCAGPLVLGAGGDDAAKARAIAERALGAEVVYLGEKHDNPHHHVHQRRILEAMLATGARPALAFEMLDAGQQAAVDGALAAGLAQESFSERLGWKARGWPDFAMYWPLFELAAGYGLAVVAVDLDPAVARRIAREGLAAAGAEGAGLGSRLGPDAERESRIAETIKEGHCGLLPESRLPFMVEAWHARNVAMARRIARALERQRQVVVIVGSGHQEAGGLTSQLEALRPGTRQFVVEMVEDRPASPSPTADIAWLTPAVARPDPCAPLRRPAQPLR
jgi:uncharacterized iron-regulated protein